VALGCLAVALLLSDLRQSRQQDLSDFRRVAPAHAPPGSVQTRVAAAGLVTVRQLQSAIVIVNRR